MPRKQHAHDCTDPSHHVHSAGDYVRAVEQACVERGLRLTPLRAQVLGLIADAGKPVKAYDLLDAMKEENGSSAPPTVYRALDFLLEQGFIHRLASVNAFVGCHHPNVRHSVHCSWRTRPCTPPRPGAGTMSTLQRMRRTGSWRQGCSRSTQEHPERHARAPETSRPGAPC